MSDMTDTLLSNLKLKDGTHVADRPLTLIIGPNNSGKSRLLKDILNRMTVQSDQKMVVLESADVSPPASPQQIIDRCRLQVHDDPNQQFGQVFFKGLGPSLVEEFRAGLPTAHLECDIFRKKQPDLPPQVFPRNFEASFGRFVVAFLSAENRLLLTKTRQSSSSQRLYPSLMFNLYEAGIDADIAISKVLADAFKVEVSLDYSALESLCLRVASQFSDREGDARTSREYMKHTPILDDQGDGLRSFTSVVTAMRVEKRPIWLIDEPEAFLHPPQAVKMGQFLAEEASDKRRLFVSTHSVDVLRGVLNKTTDVTVLRLTRDGNLNHCKILKPEQLKSIVNTPLLSSSRVLEGLFYSAAVVTEGDADNRFYQTISNRLYKGADLHFVNATNKQTLPRIVKLYRELGVRCIGIADFDVINDVNEFRNHLNDLSAPMAKIEQLSRQQKAILDSTRASLSTQLETDFRNKLKILSDEVMRSTEQPPGFFNTQEVRAATKALKGVSKEIAELTNTFQEFKKCGRSALSREMQLEFDSLSKECQQLGLLINPYGCLESMMTDCDIEYSQDKAKWITKVLGILARFEIKQHSIACSFLQLIHKIVGIESDQS